MSICDVVEELGIPSDQVKLIFVDGKKEGLEFRLSGGERVGLFPPVGGG
jgi:molybdopterin converting factor small subunit